jgi:hypothetical protein
MKDYRGGRERGVPRTGSEGREQRGAEARDRLAARRVRGVSVGRVTPWAAWQHRTEQKGSRTCTARGGKAFPHCMQEMVTASRFSWPGRRAPDAQFSCLHTDGTLVR